MRQQACFLSNNIASPPSLFMYIKASMFSVVCSQCFKMLSIDSNSCPRHTIIDMQNLSDKRFRKQRHSRQQNTDQPRTINGTGALGWFRGNRFRSCRKGRRGIYNRRRCIHRAHGVFDCFFGRACKNSKVVVLGVQMRVHETRQTIREYPNTAILVNLRTKETKMKKATTERFFEIIIRLTSQFEFF